MTPVSKFLHAASLSKSATWQVFTVYIDYTSIVFKNSEHTFIF